MLSPSLMIMMTGTMMATTMAMAAMPRAMGFTIPQPLLPRPLRPFRSGSIPSVSSSPFLAQPRRGQCQHHHDGLHQRWYPSFHMAALSSEADDASDNTPLVVNRYDSVFKNNDFWTLKDDAARIMKMLKTLPKPDARVIRDAINKMNTDGSDEAKMSAWEVDWLNRMVRFRKGVIDMVESKRWWGKVAQMAGWNRGGGHALAQWLYNARNRDNASYAWKSIEGLGGIDDPSIPLRESVRKILNILHDARNALTTHSLCRIDCADDRAAYYISKCESRQIDDASGIPQAVHMAKCDEAPDSSVVRVFFSGSGTGKTVELATSAESRNAVITLMHQADGDVATTEPNENRTNQCRAYLKRWVDTDFAYSGEVLSTIVNTVQQRLRTLEKMEATSNAAGDDEHPNVNDNRIRIVFAIDEASTCPNLAREIIRNYDDLGRDLGHYIMNNGPGGVKEGDSTGHGGLPATETPSAIEVVFSIAGTGMYRGIAGSPSKNFVCLEPSAKKDPKQTYEALCMEYDGQNRKRCKLPTYEKMMETPFMSIIASHNARMTSILINLLAESVLRFDKPDDEMRMIPLVFNKFLRCNGFSTLRTDEWRAEGASEGASKQALAVARILAIALYQEELEVPLDIETAMERAMRLDYGIEFERFGTNDINIMYHLVTRYGLVVPAPFEIFDHVVLDEDGNVQVDPAFTQPESLKKPYLVDPAIQLLCVWLLEGGKRVEDSYDFLERTLFPFEALSTQIVGSAITAATTVAQEKRKRIQSILKDTLNMQPKSSSGKTDPDNRADPDNKTDHVQEAWDALEDVTPVSVWSDFALNGMYHQQSKMSLNEPDRLIKPENVEEMNEAQFEEWLKEEIEERISAQKARMRLNRWEGLETKQLGPNFGSNPRELASSYSTADGFDASRYETLVTSLDMDKKLIQGLLKMREACANLEDDIPHSDTGSFNPTKQNFCASLTTLAEGSSNLADGYVSTAGVKKITDSEGNFLRWEAGLFTVCVQGKDMFDSRPIDYKTIRDTRDRIHHSLLDNMFGLNRLYCVAGMQDSLAMNTAPPEDDEEDDDNNGNDNGTSLYAGFPTDASPLLSESLNKLDNLRRRSRKTQDYGKGLTTREELEDAKDIVAGIYRTNPWLEDVIANLEKSSESGEESESKEKRDQSKDEETIGDGEKHDAEPGGSA